MPTTSALQKSFRNSSMIAAVAKVGVFQFKLDQTSQVLPALANCVAVIKKHGLSAAGDFAVPSLPRTAESNSRVPPPTAAPVPSSLKPAQSDEVLQEFKIEAIKLASNFIIKSSLQNLKVLSRSESLLSSHRQEQLGKLMRPRER